jgi:hypothetical protein
MPGFSVAASFAHVTTAAGRLHPRRKQECERLTLLPRGKASYRLAVIESGTTAEAGNTAMTELRDAPGLN